MKKEILRCFFLNNILMCDSEGEHDILIKNNDI
jgi:hypothetical protein